MHLSYIEWTRFKIREQLITARQAMTNQLRGLLKLFGLRLDKVTTPGERPEALFAQRPELRSVMQPLGRGHRSAGRPDQTLGQAVCRQRRGLVPDIADQPAEPVAQEPQLAAGALELMGMGVAADHDRRPPAYPFGAARLPALGIRVEDGIREWRSDGGRQPG